MEDCHRVNRLGITSEGTHMACATLGDTENFRRHGIGSREAIWRKVT